MGDEDKTFSGSTLTSKQRVALHTALAGYLYSQNFTETLDAFVTESGVKFDTAKDGKNVTKLQMLEKKWNAIVRQQKKISELEKKCKQLEEKLESAGANGGGRNNNNNNNNNKKKNKKRIIEMPAKYVLQGHRGNINVVKFHPSFGVIVSGGEDCQLKIWDWESGTFEKSLKGHTLSIQDIAFDPSGKVLASCSLDLTIKLWNFADYSNETRPVKTLHGHDHSVSGLQFTADGNFLISCSRDKTLKIWDVKTGYCVKTITGASEWIKRVVVDVSGTLLASGGHDNLIKIWKIQNVSSGALNVANELRGHEHHIESIDFSPKNCILNKKKKRKGRKQSATERRAGRRGW